VKIELVNGPLAPGSSLGWGPFVCRNPIHD
jgi:hypothetical protein